MQDGGAKPAVAPRDSFSASPMRSSSPGNGCCSMNSTQLVSQELVAILVHGAVQADDRLEWPTDSWQALQQHGVLRWSIPEAHGGQGLSARDLLSGYERLAGACATTTFLLSQREAAVR